MIAIQEFIKHYEDSIIPSYFVQNFKNDYEFKNWCRQGTIEDLYCALKAFEQYEEYEHCKIIKTVIDEKTR